MKGRDVGLRDACHFDGYAGIFVGKFYVAPGPECVVEGDGKLNGGAIADLVAHADDIWDVLSDRFSLHFGVAGVEQYTLEAIGIEFK